MVDHDHHLARMQPHVRRQVEEATTRLRRNLQTLGELKARGVVSGVEWDLAMTASRARIATIRAGYRSVGVILT
jgi:hypothetical protein